MRKPPWRMRMIWKGEKACFLWLLDSYCASTVTCILDSNHCMFHSSYNSLCCSTLQCYAAIYLRCYLPHHILHRQQSFSQSYSVLIATVKIRFSPLPAAPALTQKIFKINASNRFETVVSFLRKKLNAGPEQSVVCYINSVFAPGLDEGVGGLWKVSVIRSD